MTHTQLTHNRMSSIGFPAACEPLEGRTLLSATPEGASADWADNVPAVERRLRGGGSDKDIFGKDSRVRARSSNRPFSAVGYLESEWTRFGDRLQCSAVLVGPRHVLTAAHCVYSYDLGVADDITFVPGQDGTKSPFGSAEVERVRIEKRYRKSEDVRFDYALLTLDRNLGKQAGWMEVEAFGNKKFNDKRIYSTGYPGDLDDGQVMYHQKATANRASPTEILSDVDTAVGQSGSPVYLKADGEYYVAGVITSSTNRFAYASRITGEREERIEGWMEDDLG